MTTTPRRSTRRGPHPLLRLVRARLPRGASARRWYCDDVCRAQAYRDRNRADHAFELGLMLGEAEWIGDEGMVSC